VDSPWGYRGEGLEKRSFPFWGKAPRPHITANQPIVYLTFKADRYIIHSEMPDQREDRIVSTGQIKCVVCGAIIRFLWHESENIKRVMCPVCNAKYELDPSLPD